MSDTPRTDAAEIDNSQFSDWGIGPSGYCDVEFTRTLERELAAVQMFREAADYDPDLIARLRRVAESPEDYPEIAGLLRNAADTLEAVFATPEGGWFAAWLAADHDRQNLLLSKEHIA